jgi:hypothetical protein
MEQQICQKNKSQEVKKEIQRLKKLCNSSLHISVIGLVETSKEVSKAKQVIRGMEQILKLRFEDSMALNINIAICDAV